MAEAIIIPKKYTDSSQIYNYINIRTLQRASQIYTQKSVDTQT